MTLFDALENSGFFPRGFCLAWDPALIWLHVAADLCIAICYLSIPVVLLTLMHRRPDMSFSWIVWLFAAFITACGVTHLMSIITLWAPDYWVEGFMKLVTAALSVMTAVILWPLVLSIITLPSPAALTQLNQTLTHRMREQETLVADAVNAQRHAEKRSAHAEQMEALGQLAGGIAHDFNNILQAVASAARLIDKRPDNPTLTRERAARLIEAAERGAAIVGRLLAFARRSDMRFESIDIGATLKRMTDVLRYTLGAAIRISCDVEPNIAPLLIDRSRLETVLINLATNARDAMAETGGTLAFVADTVTLNEAHADGAAPGSYVRLAVSDNGQGMDVITLAHATEPFFTTKPQGKGTGLGLSMAKGFAEQSGGSFNIESTPNQGTTITLLLPQAQRIAGAADNGGIQQAVHDMHDTNRTPPHVLFVDDDPIIRDLVTEELRELGLLVVPAAGGQEALALLAGGMTIDVLITDFSMARMNGLTLVRRVRQDQPHIRTIMLTGLIDDDEGGLIQVGEDVDVLLRKPVTGVKLNRCVMELMEQLHPMPAAD